MARKNKYKPRPDGRYLTHVSTGKRDPETGKLIRITVYAKSSSELERKVGEVKTDLHRGTYADDKGMTFGMYAENNWLPAKYNEVDYPTYTNYERIVRNHMDEIYHIRLQDLTKSDVQRQINLLQDKPETRRMLLLTVRQVLESAIDDTLIYKNVARKIKVASPPKSDKRPLTDAEKSAIRSANLSPQEKILIDLLYCSGVRRSEAVALMKSDFNFARSEVYINKSLTWKGGKRIKSTKSSSSVRTIGLPKWFTQEVRDYLADREQTSLYLFCDTNGELMSESTFRRTWNRAYDAIMAKIPKNATPPTKLTPHTFRHNYCTMLYYAGVDVKEAQRLMGHSSIKITLEIYTHLATGGESTREKLNAITI